MSEYWANVNNIRERKKRAWKLIGLTISSSFESVKFVQLFVPNVNCWIKNDAKFVIFRFILTCTIRMCDRRGLIVSKTRGRLLQLYVCVHYTTLISVYVCYPTGLWVYSWLMCVSCWGKRLHTKHDSNFVSEKSLEPSIVYTSLEEIARERERETILVKTRYFSLLHRARVGEKKCIYNSLKKKQ